MQWTDITDSFVLEDSGWEGLDATVLADGHTIWVTGNDEGGSFAVPEDYWPVSSAAGYMIFVGSGINSYFDDTWLPPYVLFDYSTASLELPGHGEPFSIMWPYNVS